MAVQEGRSKDRFVRLEPFFTKATVEAPDGPGAEAPKRLKSRGIGLMPGPP
jgi:hypothetical protein